MLFCSSLGRSVGPSAGHRALKIPLSLLWQAVVVVVMCIDSPLAAFHSLLSRTLCAVHRVVVTALQAVGCCAGVYEWRDGVARVEDESPAFVLPKAQLLKLAQVQSSARHRLGPEVDLHTSFQSGDPP